MGARGYSINVSCAASRSIALDEDDDDPWRASWRPCVRSRLCIIRRRVYSRGERGEQRHKRSQLTESFDLSLFSIHSLFISRCIRDFCNACAPAFHYFAFNYRRFSTDFLQVYKGLDIVTAKVTSAERQMAPHHLLDVVDPLTVDFTVLQFREMALPIVILSSFLSFSCFSFYSMRRRPVLNLYRY